MPKRAVETVFHSLLSLGSLLPRACASAAVQVRLIGNRRCCRAQPKDLSEVRGHREHLCGIVLALSTGKTDGWQMRSKRTTSDPPGGSRS
jgi:hypothetical protein